MNEKGTIKKGYRCWVRYALDVKRAVVREVLESDRDGDSVIVFDLAMFSIGNFVIGWYGTFTMSEDSFRASMYRERPA